MWRKKFAMGFNLIFLLRLASGTAWASHPVIASARVRAGESAPIAPGQITAPGDIWPFCTSVASLCTTGSFDAILRRSHVTANRDGQVATTEIPTLSPNPAAHSGHPPSSVWSDPARVSPLPVGNNPDSTLIRTGVFPGAGERVISNSPVQAVRTGVFEGPERFLEEAQGDSPGNLMRLGFWRLPQARGEGTGTEKPHGIHGLQFRKRGKGTKIGSGSQRDR